MNKQVATTLPIGYWKGGAYWREAHLRQLTGADHLLLMEQCRELLPAQWITETLARCVSQLGPTRGSNDEIREAIRSLTVGDRDALLLHLRRFTSGDRLNCVLWCPRSECQEKLEFEISISDLLRSTESEGRPEHELTVYGEDGRSTLVKFRLPSGSDQEAVAALALTDVGGAADTLLRRCVLSVSTDGELIEQIPISLTQQLPARMAELDPHAEIIVTANCETCGGSFNFVFDAASYLSQELQNESERLYREVHLLAFHYHWSLTEILGLTTQERRRFLSLLEQELSEGVGQ